jgi:translation elongation factor EF-Tu-like GTPase
MTRPDFGVSLRLHIDLLPTSAGGRTQPVRSGYRPICIMQGTNGAGAVIGLCELQLEHQLAPGHSGEGRLSFDPAVSNDVRGLLRVGSRFVLAEGTQPIGSAEVRAIDPG